MTTTSTAAALRACSPGNCALEADIGLISNLREALTEHHPRP